MARKYGAATFPYFSLASGFLTGKYRSPDDLEGRNRQGFIEGYATAEGFAVIDALLGLAWSRGVEPATVALAWQLAKGVTAPIASVSTAEQLPALIAASTLELTEDEVASLDDASQPFS